MDEQAILKEAKVSYRFSPALGELTQALAAAQSDFQPIKKDKRNPHTGSMYADLNSVVAATQPALAKNGLVVIQLPVIEGQMAGVVSRLTHTSGEYAEVELLLPATMPKKKKFDRDGEAIEDSGNVKFDAQSVGSAITYSRRYTYGPQVGAVAEDDDDGNAAADSQTAPQSEVRRPKPPKMDTAPAKQGESKPAPKPVQNTPPADSSPDPAPAKDNGIPKAQIPAEAAPADPSNIPDKSVFDKYTARAVEMKIPLEKAGLRASKGLQTGAKLKQFLLSTVNRKELTELTVADWEGFFSKYEPLVQTEPQKVVELIDPSPKEESK